MTDLPAGRYFGHTTRRHELGGLTFTETVYAPEQRVPRHAHERAYLCFVVAGEFTERTAGRTRRCAASEVLLHPAGEAHADRFHGRGGRCLNVELGDRLLALGGGPAEPRQFAGGPVTWLARRLHRELGRADAAPLVVEGLALEMIGEAL